MDEEIFNEGNGVFRVKPLVAPGRVNINEQAVLASFSLVRPRAAGELAEAGLIKDLASLMREARDCFNENTLPWWEVGARLLPLGNYAAFVEMMTTLRVRYDETLAELAEWSGQAREHGVTYPAHATWDVQARPLAVEFSLVVVAVLPEGHGMFLEMDLERRVSAATSLATLELWSRLQDNAAHLHDRMRSYNGKHAGSFHSTTLLRVSEAVERLRRLDLGIDPAYALALSEVAQIVNAWTSAELRASATARAEVAEVAARVLASIPAFTKPAMTFGTGE